MSLFLNYKPQFTVSCHEINIKCIWIIKLVIFIFNLYVISFQGKFDCLLWKWIYLQISEIECLRSRIVNRLKISLDEIFVQLQIITLIQLNFNIFIQINIFFWISFWDELYILLFIIQNLKRHLLYYKSTLNIRNYQFIISHLYVKIIRIYSIYIIYLLCIRILVIPKKFSKIILNCIVFLFNEQT